MADPITWGLINLVRKGIKGVQTTLDGLLGDIKDEFGNFLNDAEEVIDKLGTGVPPRDMISFRSKSTDDGIKLTFTPPKPTYFSEHTNGDGKQFACMPAGVLIRYSDTNYPRTPDDGVFGYDYKPAGDWDTESHECTIVGLTKNTKYYFTAFPYSTENAFNKNQTLTNRTECTWADTGSITVNVTNGPNAVKYGKSLGEYTVSLIDQSNIDQKNYEKTASGENSVKFDGLTNDKQYRIKIYNSDYRTNYYADAVTVLGGDNIDIEFPYDLSSDLNEYSWSEIKDMAISGMGSDVFPLGAKKMMSCKYMTGDFNVNDPGTLTKPLNITLSDMETNVILVSKKWAKNGGSVYAYNDKVLGFLTEKSCGKSRLFYNKNEEITMYSYKTDYENYVVSNQETIFPDVCEYAVPCRMPYLEVRNTGGGCYSTIILATGPVEVDLKFVIPSTVCFGSLTTVDNFQDYWTGTTAEKEHQSYVNASNEMDNNGFHLPYMINNERRKLGIGKSFATCDGVYTTENKSKGLCIPADGSNIAETFDITEPQEYPIFFVVGEA